MHEKAVLAAVVAAAALSLPFILGGCACSNSTIASSGSTHSNAPTSAFSSAMTSVSGSSASGSVVALQIGKGAVSVEIVNATGYDINSLSIMPSNQSDYATDATYTNFLFKDGATADLSYAKSDDPSQQYDLKFKTTGDGTIAVSNVSFTNVSNLTIRFDEGFGYVTYVETTTGKAVSGFQQAKQDQAEASKSDSYKNYDTENQAG